MKMTYPVTRAEETTDVLHGVAVPDPYRWLEDANSAQTRAWIDAQNAVTFGYLRQIPERETLQQRLTTLWNYEKITLPYREGDRYFYSRNSGLQNQFVLYVADSLHGESRVLLDPNTLSVDGTVALSGTSVSRDGKYLAYGLSEAGSDWQEWRVRNIESGEDLTDHLKWLKFSSASWTPDNQGFFYSRYAEPKAGEEYQATNYYRKLYYHRLGEDQADDILIYERPDHKDWGISGYVTEDGNYLLIYIFVGTERRNRIFYKDLTDPNSEVVEWLAEADAYYAVVDNDGPIFYVLTDKDAPRKQLVAMDLRNPSPENWRMILPEAEETLLDVSLFGERFIALYLKDAHSQVRLFDMQGGVLGTVALPGIGTVSGFHGKRHHTETFYQFSSYTTPPTIYRYDLTTDQSTLYRQPQVAFNPAEYETRQVFFHSKDGTRVPMFLTYRKGLTLDGTNPTYLYGYGGFNISLTPNFSVSALTWLEMGGIYVVVNLRGGGEYGEAWHQAGTKLQKQNVFDDFIAAAEYLIAEKYTSPEKLAIAGGSNGGLLVGACMTQRPDLYAACIPAVGVLDMIRFHLYTVGWGWVSDYGSPDNPEEFAALMAYSPYHNLKPGTRYPATLIVTSDHDDRVVPAHSFKYAAALQAAQNPDGPPTLIRIETRAGHGAGKPTTKVIEEVADIYAFLLKSLNHSLPENFGK